MLFVVFVDHENSYYSVSTLERRRPKHDKHRRHSGGKITGVKIKRFRVEIILGW